ncbi:hypothetical protein [Streptomyces sp. NPDC047028]|uniref:hypothetical protein n=1 Tax=Streptomyces sp. NPDC047028 TaxID=3155793 RepID=UPI0033CBF959
MHTVLQIGELLSLFLAAVFIAIGLEPLIALPEIKQFGFRFVAASRRTRVETVTEEILARTGRFMLANLATSGIAGVDAERRCSPFHSYYR